VPALLAQAEISDADKASVWDDLWRRLCHEGTVYTASYAALPALAAIVVRANVRCCRGGASAGHSTPIVRVVVPPRGQAGHYCLYRRRRPTTAMARPVMIATNPTIRTILAASSHAIITAASTAKASNANAAPHA
jgi:hypothetical protein